MQSIPLALDAEIAFGYKSPFECIISVPTPNPVAELGLPLSGQWTVAGRSVFSFFTRVLLFCQTCCLWEPSATENSISQAPCKSRALCPALRRMQRCGSHHPHRQAQSVTWMGDTQQNCEGRRKLSREPVNSSSPILGKFFPSPDPGFLFCVVETSGPIITSFPSCFETSILSAR